MNLFFKLLFTAALGALDLWAGIPLGLALGLSPVVCGVAATAGGLLGAALVTVAGERLQHWLYRRGWLSKRRKRIERMWRRYGILGVALQAPMLTGAPLGTLVALSLGAPARRLLIWMSVSVVLWGAVLTGVAALGFSTFDAQQTPQNATAAPKASAPGSETQKEREARPQVSSGWGHRRLPSVRGPEGSKPSVALQTPRPVRQRTQEEWGELSACWPRHWHPF